MNKNLHYFFSLINFKVNDLNVQLVLPETWQAPALYEVIKCDRENIGKWLPWAYQTKSAADEVKFIKIIQQKMLEGQLIALTIVVNNQPCGMIDLHNLTAKQKAEIGYWLSSKYQGHGIMKKSVLELCQYAFSQLKFRYIDILVALKNDKSSHVAQNAGFKLIGIKQKVIQDTFPAKVFRKINPN